MSDSPNFIGKRVWIPAADHLHSDEEGVVVAQEQCELCQEKGFKDCGYDDLIVKLDSGEMTRVYEPEAMPSKYYLEELERVRED